MLAIVWITKIEIINLFKTHPSTFINRLESNLELETGGTKHCDIFSSVSQGQFSNLHSCPQTIRDLNKTAYDTKADFSKQPVE